jgi:putative nucleotidyltransferase with HDIG domain
LERIAASDPVLSARLLGAANSAQFGSRFEILRLREAILRVGVPEARRIAIACCLAGLFASRRLRQLWEHSQAVAYIMLNLARFCGIDAETAWLAGLLHDIGRLGLMVFPADRRALEESWLQAGFPRVYAEALAYGTDHFRLGGEILRGWDLPERIVDAVALHHRPGRSAPLLTATLYLAEDLSAQDAGASSEDLWPGMWRRSACERTGISLERLRAFNEMRCSMGAACA